MPLFPARLFRVTTEKIRSSDHAGYIPNWESTIKFEVTDELMAWLEDVQEVDVRPADDIIKWTLQCEVEQASYTYEQTQGAAIEVRGYNGYPEGEATTTQNPDDPNNPGGSANFGVSVKAAPWTAALFALLAIGWRQ